ncbi:MAG: CapA family protein [Anaerolineae bacterium]
MGKRVIFSGLLITLIILDGCAEVAPTGVPTPLPTSPPPAVTPTPLPTATPTSPPTPPLPTATPTQPPTPPLPTVTPTPIPPSTLWVEEAVPGAVRAALQALVESQADDYAWALTEEGADVRVGVALTAPATTVAWWVYALVAPFPTLIDDVAWSDFEWAWQGTVAAPFNQSPLLMTAETEAALSALLGPPSAGAVEIVPAEVLLDKAWARRPSWAVVPFDELEPRWKVLQLDGASILNKGLDMDSYPLVVQVGIAGPPLAAADLRAALSAPLTNRDVERMTVLAMTGVMALVRATAWRMETKGLLYPALKIGDVLRNADLTHISNEIPFVDSCPPPDPVQEDLVFCSAPRYLELLKYVGADIIELTGNHMNDYGAQAMLDTLALYDEAGMLYYAGGRDLAAAQAPLIVESNGNYLAFLGCNYWGPEYDWATADGPGSAPCDYAFMHDEIARLKNEVDVVIMTFQYVEHYDYVPTPEQVVDFRGMADAGASIVSGSQSHHPMGMEFRDNGFITYGLGNLFFDQMFSLGTRQEFIARHAIYRGRHISTELVTAMLEDYAQPRLASASERCALLEAVFKASGW